MYTLRILPEYEMAVFSVVGDGGDVRKDVVFPVYLQV